MPYIAVSASPIRVRRTTDPGFGQGAAPGDPGYGHPEGGHPGNELPGGGYPSHGLPGGGDIDNSLPMPPPGIWPPPSFNHPWAPIPPDASTKPPPGAVWPPLGQDLPDGQFWVVAGIPGVGWRYVAVDLTLQAGNELPGGRPSRPDNTLPPTPQPKE